VNITKLDFEEVIGMPIPLSAQKFTEANNFNYKTLSKYETNLAFIKYIDFLVTEKKISGPEYLEFWEIGWKENLDLFRDTLNISALLPKFIRKNSLIRFQGKFIAPEDPNFESNFVEVIRETVFQQYFSDSESIWEFGCGTGLNLVHLSRIFPEKQLVGCDWALASVHIIKELSKSLGLNLDGQLFDIFNPNLEILDTVPANSGLLTVGTMEQIGAQFFPFLNALLNSKFKIIIHLETNYELYDKTDLFDYFPVKYIEKRNWLTGYFSELRKLEGEGKIEILHQKKTFGSFFHDGYTITIWENKHV